MAKRKAILTATRVQRPLLSSYLAAHRLYPDIGTPSVYYNEYGNQYTIDIMSSLSQEFITSPVISGFLSMLVRNAPVESIKADVEEIMESTIRKEIGAAIDTLHPYSFPWHNIFDASSSRIPLHPQYRYEQGIYSSIRRAFSTAHRDLSGKIFYPDYSSKTLGRLANSNLQSLSIALTGEESDPSTLGLERLYEKFGVKVDGVTEMRMAWKFNDLKPRVYYARGPDVYYASRYVQTIFNYLVDLFPVTHRQERYHHNTIRLPSDEVSFIYDYSSFTSRLHEIRNFTERLADFFDDTIVRLFDTRDGIITMSLGSILRTFNESCNLSPEFDVARVSDLSSDSILVHNCGMLGVPGNISSCTLLHGLHLMCLLGEDSVKVVGDDAFGHSPVFADGLEREEIINGIRNIGDVSEPKTEWWGLPRTEEFEDEGWHYCKRPFDVFENRIVVGKQFVFPPMAELLGFVDDYHTRRAPVDDVIRYRRLASRLITFVRQFSEYVMTEEEVKLVDGYLRLIVSETGIAQYTEAFGRGLVYPKRFYGGDVLADLVNEYWDTVVTLPIVCDHSMQTRLEPGLLYVGRMPRPLKICLDLGYGSASMQCSSFIVRDDPDRFSSFLTKSRVNLLYEIYVSELCPRWIVDHVNELLSLPVTDDDMDYAYLGFDEYRDHDIFVSDDDV